MVWRGDACTEEKGSYSVLASDILDGIAEVLTAESTEMIFREKC